MILIFNLNKKIFNKKGYKFHFQFRTDGYSVILYFIKNNLVRNEKTNKFKTKQKKENIEEIYINKDILNKYNNIICIDPNLKDLIYCGELKNETNKELNIFRYTQNQRRKQLKLKKFSKNLNKLKEETTINNKTIKEIESELTNYNSKTNDFNKFKEFVYNKNKINNILFNFYQNEYFRKIKLNIYSNTQRSEDNLINNFNKKFNIDINNKPLIVFGDYEKQNNFKGTEPTINKKLRDNFRKKGFEVCLINECNTSKVCSFCLNKSMKPFLTRNSKKPNNIKVNKNGETKIKTEIVFGLLRCESCKIIQHRDKNSVRNFFNICSQMRIDNKRLKCYINSDHKKE